MNATKTLILNTGSSEAKRAEILRYLSDTWQIEELLYQSLAKDEVFYKRADPLRHPLIFYLGHTAVFYVNKLNVGKVINQRFNPLFESTFAIGVDEMSWDDLNEAHYDWPSVEEVRVYRRTVQDFLINWIKESPLEMPITWDSPWWAIMMGIEHQRIHLETSSVLIRQLPLQDLVQLSDWPICPQRGNAPQNTMVSIPGGTVSIGKADDDTHYGWDNEYGKAEYEVQDFLASKYLVSNGEYMEFIAAGGYHKRDWWTDEGWAWKEFEKAEMPRFWTKAETGYFLRTMASQIELPPSWPVEVNYLEAKAFCNWKAATTGKPIRLPMEEEWKRMRDLHYDSDQPYWDKAPGNINLEYWASACPVDHFDFGGIYDVIGNLWQWTETPIYGLPGFKIHPIYDDFSTPTFDGKHNLIKGGSWISTGNEALQSSRYAFRRHFYQHAGFRYIESNAPVVNHDLIYETDPELCLAADADWAPDRKLDNRYPGLVILALADIIQPQNNGSILHIGCKTGRLSFELARYFDHVTGVDFTARMVKLAQQMLDGGYFRYIRKEEGENTSFVEARLDEYGLADLGSKLEFWQADLSNLMPKFSGYDYILVDGMLSRSTNPKRFLADVQTRLKPGGYLLIADDWDWREDLTVKENWIGAIRRDGEPFSSMEALTELLGDRFEQIGDSRDIVKTLPLCARLFESRVYSFSIWHLK